jgi:hypothetical protein
LFSALLSFQFFRYRIAALSHLHMDDEINTIIKQLKSHKVKESRLIRDLEDSVQRARTLQPAFPTASAPRRTTPVPSTVVFNVGDKVCITNKVKQKSNRHPITEKDRIAIVTTVTEQRVFIRTLNCTETWRAPHNLRHYGNLEYCYARAIPDPPVARVVPTDYQERKALP